MEIKKTTSGTPSTGTKPTSQKPSSESKKASTPVIAEKSSAPSEKISTGDKYEKAAKSDKKEEFFDDLSHLRSMSDKDSVKKEDKKKMEEPHKERKNLLTSIMSVSKEALKLAKSALEKLSSCGDTIPQSTLSFQGR